MISQDEIDLAKRALSTQEIARRIANPPKVQREETKKEYESRQRKLAREAKRSVRNVKAVFYLGHARRERRNGQLNKNFQVVIVSRFFKKRHTKVFATLSEAIAHRDEVWAQIAEYKEQEKQK